MLFSIPALAQYSGGGGYGGGQPAGWIGPIYSVTSTTSSYGVNQSGQRIGFGGGTSSGQNLTQQQMNAYSPLDLNFSFPSYLVSGHSEMTAGIKAVFKYYDASGNPASPPVSQQKLYILEDVSANYMAHVAGDCQADDGLNDAVRVFGEYGESSGRHLIQKDGSSGTVTIELAMSTKANASIDYFVNSSGIHLQIWNKQSLDTRSATIYCSDLESGGNYHKGSNVLPELNVRKEDGSMAIDTTIDHLSSQSDNNPVFVHVLSVSTTGFDVASTNWNYLTGTGLVNTQIDWSGNPGHSYSSASDHTGLNVLSSEYIYGTQMPYKLKYHVKVKDLRPNLDATAENDYTVTVHRPFENPIKIVDPVVDHCDPYSSSAWVTPNSPVSVEFVSPGKRSWSFRGQTSSGIWGSILSGICGSGLTALCVTNPELAWVGIVGDMAFNAIGWTASTNPADSEVIQSLNLATNQAAFHTSIQEQKDINNQTGTVDCDNEPRFIGNSVDLAILAANESTYWRLSPITGRCHSGDRVLRYTLVGDGYGANGYAGLQFAEIKTSIAKINPVWQWTVAPLVGN